MKADKLFLEIEMRTYLVKPTNKKWYQFWLGKTKRVLMKSENETELLHELKSNTGFEL